MREQQAVGARDRDGGQTGGIERRAQRAGGEEADVVGAGVERALEGAAAEAGMQARQEAVVGRREEQSAVGRERAADLREQAEPILDVLEHLGQPDRVELAVGERQLRAAERELDRGKARAGAPQGLLRDVGADDLEAALRQQPAEVAEAAAEVENALALAQLGEEEVAARLEALGRAVRGAPETVEVGQRRGR